ncbi:hypothetical protein BKA66DRAFT_405370 [Pyrenochaeta sp. MPI-SDFR-AT-0127]|nr:hypothetical protein BKA66DRAFT_405370 [Pyrenochaeta sp. MPI-SDFR-AT-0127]
MTDANTAHVSTLTTSQRQPDSREIECWQARATEMRDLKQWSDSIQIITPIPKDLLPILAKDEVKQMEIVLKTMKLEDLGRN